MTQEPHLSLNDLTRGLPSDSDSEAIISDLTGASDRTAAIVLSAMLETVLYYSLRSRLMDYEAVDALFYGATAPCADFSARIKLGRALGIYGPQTERALNTIRKIRNVFAHAYRNVSFETHAVVSLCRELEKQITQRAGDSTEFALGRKLYTAGCMECATLLAEDAKAFQRRLDPQLP